MKLYLTIGNIVNRNRVLYVKKRDENVWTYLCVKKKEDEKIRFANGGKIERKQVTNTRQEHHKNNYQLQRNIPGMWVIAEIGILSLRLNKLKSLI